MKPSGTSRVLLKNANTSLPPWTIGYSLSHVATFLLSSAVVMAAQNFHDITDTMAFYGVYHRNPYNQLIHFFGVPYLIYTYFVFFVHLPLQSLFQLAWNADQRLKIHPQQFQLQMPLIPTHTATWAILWLVGYVAFYLSIDPIGALLFSPVLYFLYGAAVVHYQRDQRLALDTQGSNSTNTVPWTGTGRLLQDTLLGHVLAWYLQIHPGHRILEGAQPALMKSLGGALTSAPLFAFYEGLWFLGIRRSLQEQVVILVDTYTRQLCASDPNLMRACSEVRF
jgi:2-hydroxy fatty acid dioxygenase